LPFYDYYLYYYEEIQNKNHKIKGLFMKNNKQLIALLLLATSVITISAYRKNNNPDYTYDDNGGVVRTVGQGTVDTTGKVVRGTVEAPGKIVTGIFGGGNRDRSDRHYRNQHNKKYLEQKDRDAQNMTDEEFMAKYGHSRFDYPELD
jgi:hypothetical protein